MKILIISLMMFTVLPAQAKTRAQLRNLPVVNFQFNEDGTYTRTESERHDRRLDQPKPVDFTDTEYSVAAVRCPDGTYIAKGKCVLCPNGDYVKDKCHLTPAGYYVGE